MNANTGSASRDIAQELRNEAQPAWSEAVHHPFVKQLGNDTLPDEVFRRYLVQDYAFIDALIGLVGFAIGDAPSRQAKENLTRFLGVLTEDETDYFHRSFEALDVPADDRTNPAIMPVTQAFEDLVYRAGREGYPSALSVLLPAEWIYLTWATRIKSDQDRFYLREWVELHATPEFERFVTWLRDEFNTQATNLSTARQNRISRHFQRTCELERAFFDAAFEG